MSNYQRGQEVRVRIKLAGAPAFGSWLKVAEFDETPRTTLHEIPLLGENGDDVDIQHNGWDVSGTLKNIDSATIDYMDDLAASEEAHLPPPRVDIQVTHAYRQPGTTGRLVTYKRMVMKIDSYAWRNRKEITETKFSAKCKTRVVQKVA